VHAGAGDQLLHLPLALPAEGALEQIALTDTCHWDGLLNGVGWWWMTRLSEGTASRALAGPSGPGPRPEPARRSPVRPRWRGRRRGWRARCRRFRTRAPPAP